MCGGSHQHLTIPHSQGDIRAVHAHILESYQLKSQDVVLEGVLDHLLFGWDAATGRVTVEDVYAPNTEDAFGRPRSRGFLREPGYDAVIAAPGWRFSTDLFGDGSDGGVVPALHANKKHPALAAGRYESANVPGLFFAGTAMHAHDHKKSSGGFIHGFRYLCRALHRQLEELEVDDAAARVVNRSSATLPAVDAAPLSLPPVVLGYPPAPWPRASQACGLRGLVAALLRRINLAAGPFQVFGGLADVLVLSPINAEADVSAFTNVSTLASLYEPWSFPLPSATCAAAAARDVFAPRWYPRPGSASSPADAETARTAAAAASDAALEAALRGDLFEEVPTGAVPAQAERWAGEAAASKGRSDPRASVEWITLTLEFGASPPPGGGERMRDPFSLSRAHSDLRTPEGSHFLHPVLRYYERPLLARKAAAAPVLRSELHILEDPHASWTVHEAHVLPLARWLQELGAQRIAAARHTVVAAPPLPPLRAARQSRRPLRAILLDWFMADDAATLLYRGVSVQGGSSGWFLALSERAADSLCATHAEACTETDGVAVHFVPAHLLQGPGVGSMQKQTPLSAEEAAFTAALREQLMHAGASANSARGDAARSAVTAELNASLSAHMVPRPPPGASADAVFHLTANPDSAGFFLEAAYRGLSRQYPGLPIIVYALPRAGLGTVKAEVFGLKNPFMQGLFLCAGLQSPAAAALEAAADAADSTLLPVSGGGLALQIRLRSSSGSGSSVGDLASGSSAARAAGPDPKAIRELAAVWHDAEVRTARAAREVK